MIECSNVVKRFGDFTALDGVSLHAASGVCILLGPNGAGKSTLLKALTGLLPIDTGSIRVAGLDVSRRPIDLRRNIGVLPEDLGLFDSLTIGEHLDLCGPINDPPRCFASCAWTMRGIFLSNSAHMG
jgi:ABC-2 type transport system ATP-binding protein